MSISEEQSGISKKANRKIMTKVRELSQEIKTRSFEEVKDEIVKYLEEMTPTEITEVVDDNENTLAHLAVKEDKIDAIKLVVESYLSILGATDKFFKWFFMRNNNNQTCVEISCQNGTINIIKYLYSIISKTSEDKFGLNENRNNIFHNAALFNQQYPIIFFYEKLQSFFIDTLIIDKPNEVGITPLHYACIKGSKQCIDLLLDLGVNINSVDVDGNSCLHYAVRSKEVRVVKKLLVRGAKKNIKNKDGLMPYQLAEQENEEEIANITKFPTNCLAKIFPIKSEIKNIKGNRNNLTLLLILLLFILAKTIFILRVIQGFTRKYQNYFIPYVIKVELDNTESYFDFGTYRECEEVKSICNRIYYKDRNCPHDTTNFCTVESTFYVASFFVDLILTFIVFSFILFEGEEKGNDKKKEDSLASMFEKNSSICVKCRQFLEKGTFHCIVCNRCVKNYDHHCYWLNSCITKKNIKCFYLFLFFMALFLVCNCLVTLINIIDTQKLSDEFYMLVMDNMEAEKGKDNSFHLKSENLKIVEMYAWYFINSVVFLGCLYSLLLVFVPGVMGLFCKCKKKRPLRLEDMEARLIFHSGVDDYPKIFSNSSF